MSLPFVPRSHMGLADGIRKRGFRTWYERTLIRSHAYLVLTLLCAIGVMAAFEVHSRGAPWSDQLFDAAAIVLCGAVGVHSLRRYLFLLTYAERIAQQAVCPNCKTYARFRVTAEDRVQQQLTVHCRQCEHEWPISH